MSQGTAQGFRVGEWTVEPLDGSVCGPDGKTRHLQPKVMDTLVLLAENAGKLVTRDELLNEVWGEYAVSDEPLTRVIGELRRALDDDRSNPRYIATIPKRGYKLIEPVEFPAGPRQVSDQEPETSQLPRSGRWPRKVSLAVVAGMIAVGIYVLVWNWIDRGPGGPAVIEAPPRSIAVMPFSACAGLAEGQIFARGIADEVRNRLAYVDTINVSAAEPLAVTAQSSSAILWDRGIDHREIAERLNVRFLLSATICENEDDLVAQMSLIDGRGNIAQSAEVKRSMPGTKMPAVTISQAMSNTVAGWLGALPAGSGALTENVAAHEALIKGRRYLEQGDRERAEEWFTKSADLDPDYAEPRIHLALMQQSGLRFGQQSGYERALEIGEEAKRLALQQYLANPMSFDATLLAGTILRILAGWEREIAWRAPDRATEASYRAKFAEAEDYLRAALAMNPSSTPTATILAAVLDERGEKEESLAILEAARNNDPFNLDLNKKVAERWAATGRDREAFELLRRFEEPALRSVDSWNKQLELLQIHTYWDEEAEVLIRLLTQDPKSASSGQLRFQLSWFASTLLHLGLDEESDAWRARIPVDDFPPWARITIERFYLWGEGDQQALARWARGHLDNLDEDRLFDNWYSLPLGWAVAIAQAGDIEEAVAILDKVQFAPTLRDERDNIAALALAELYDRTGRIAERDEVLERVVTNLQREVAGGARHPEMLFQLAEAYALMGRNETAIQSLQMAVDYHFRKPWWRLPWNSTIGGLASDPRVQSMRQLVEDDLQTQAERIRDMLSEHDVDELLAPVRERSH